MMQFGKHQITRLISGANPLTGVSHWSARRSSEMADHHVAQPENAVAFMHALSKAGVNVIQARGDYHRVMHWLELFNREGGKLHWIAQTASEMHDPYRNIRVIAAHDPIGIYHHGSQTDMYWKQGKIEIVRDYLKCMRDQGVMVGLAAHIPEIYDYVEDKGWDLDFYMACFYFIGRKDRHSELVSGKLKEVAACSDDSVPSCDEEFSDEDPPQMCKFIRQTKKTCLAYKILGAGRQCSTQQQVRNAFEFAFANIKPTDGVVVGMWQKHADQISLNVEHAKAAIAASEV
jgi:hypothetical protein